MNKINDGDYFRTKNGFIGKIKRIIGKDPCFNNMNYYETDILYTMPGCYSSYRIYEDMFKKHSKNIMDLIEVDDYVNGYRVSYKNKKSLEIEDSDYSCIEAYEIESIVTHERFKNIEYRIDINEEGG